MTVQDIVQKNLDFYNQGDADGFASVLCDDIELCEFGATAATLSGIDKVKAMYKELFANSPALHSTILSRIVIGNKVIDHESIVGRNGSTEVIELVLIYEVNNSLISKISVMRP